MKPYFVSGSPQHHGLAAKPLRPRSPWLPATLYSVGIAAVFVLFAVGGVLSSAFVGFGVTYLIEAGADEVKTLTGFSLESHIKDFVGFPLIAGLVGSGLMCVFILRALIGMFAGGYAVNASVLDRKVTAAVEEVAAKVGVSRFAGVRVEVEPAAFRTLYVGFGRYVVLSALMLKYLTENEFRAIVAHECAHHHHNAMLLSRLHYRNAMIFEGFRRAVIGSTRTVDKWEKSGWAANLSGLVSATLLPFMLSLAGYRWLVEKIGDRIVDPEYEFYCDSVAIDLVGGAVLASALKKIGALQIATLQARANPPALATPTDDVLEAIDVRFRLQPERLLALYMEAEQSVVSPTHPPLTERLRRALQNPSAADLSRPLLSGHQADALCKSLGWRKA